MHIKNEFFYNEGSLYRHDTLFKTGTASVESKKTELGVWESVRGRSPLRKCLGVLDALS